MKFLCDGHEYNFSPQQLILRNNYGQPVASVDVDTMFESITVFAANEVIAETHLNNVVRRFPDQGALRRLGRFVVQTYVAWAMDNETVEEHA